MNADKRSFLCWVGNSLRLSLSIGGLSLPGARLPRRTPHLPGAAGKAFRSHRPAESAAYCRTYRPEQKVEQAASLSGREVRLLILRPAPQFLVKVPSGTGAHRTRPSSHALTCWRVAKTISPSLRMPLMSENASWRALCGSRNRSRITPLMLPISSLEARSL